MNEQERIERQQVFIAWLKSHGMYNMFANAATMNGMQQVFDRLEPALDMLEEVLDMVEPISDVMEARFEVICDKTVVLRKGIR